jgi:hypothetical protein
MIAFDVLHGQQAATREHTQERGFTIVNNVGVRQVAKACLVTTEPEPVKILHIAFALLPLLAEVLAAKNLAPDLL